MLNDYVDTCSIDRLRHGCVSFIRTEAYIKYLFTDQKVGIFVPKTVGLPHGIPKNVEIFYVDNPDYSFTVFHNELHKFSSPKDDVYGENCSIHSSAVIGEGIRLANGPNGEKVQLKHMGNVVFGDNVYVGPLTIVERGTLTSTILEDGVKVDAQCCIGHNSIIGANTVFSIGAIVGGSARIGKDCWVGFNAIIRNGVTVCDEVIIGMGTLVTKDITESGVYVGTPARRIKDYVRGFNF